MTDKICKTCVWKIPRYKMGVPICDLKLFPIADEDTETCDNWEEKE